MAAFKSFEQLECWKEARNLRNFVQEQIDIKIPMMKNLA